MDCFARSHLSDPSVHESAAVHASGARRSTAHLLADIAEIDERKLYLPAGYTSLLAYCVGELRLSADEAGRRIQAARAARRFPAIFHAVAEGRLHLTAVGLLAPHLTEDTAAELLVACAHKSKSEIEQILAARFPVSDVLTWVVPSGPAALPRPVDEHALAHVQAHPAPGPADRSRVKPLSAQSFAVQFTLGQEDHDNLVCAQELLSHEIPSGDLAAVFSLALKALLPQLRKRRFAATEKPRPGNRRPSADSRHLPDHVRRAVWERDGGRCTFVSDDGHRCEARTFVEFDHVEAFARGGEATVSTVRLLCRAHNQYEAERTFGAEFMRHKRIAAAEARAAAKAEAKARAAAEQAVRDAHVLEVVPYLRQLGYNAREARDAAELCREMRGASLEARVRVALTYFRPRGTKLAPAGATDQAMARAS